MSELLHRCLKLFSEGLDPAAPEMNQFMRITAAEMLLGVLREEKKLTGRQLLEATHALGWSHRNIDILMGIGHNVHSPVFEAVDHTLTDGYRVVRCCQMSILLEKMQENHEREVLAHQEKIRLFELMERQPAAPDNRGIDIEDDDTVVRIILIAGVAALVILLLTRVFFPELAMGWGLPSDGHT